MSRSGKYQSLTWFAFFLTILGSAGLKMWGLEYGQLWLYATPLTLDGYGFGTGLTTTLIALLASVEQKGWIFVCLFLSFCETLVDSRRNLSGASFYATQR